MSLIARIREDLASVKERDPAARSLLEILLCYPGLWAVWIHRISHRLWKAHFRLGARLLSQVARFFTGVDIHPGALIGRRLFIDHATGVVIGETTIVGSDVTMYQGVTLGGTGKGHGKRHPTICDGVFIGNNANTWATSPWVRTRASARAPWYWPTCRPTRPWSACRRTLSTATASAF
jgi:serine O-acetyltransferase